MTGVAHYMFTSEFMNTSFALRSTIKGLSIAISNFVNRNRSLNKENMITSKTEENMEEFSPEEHLRGSTEIKECMD